MCVSAGVKYCLSDSEDEPGNWASLGRKKAPAVDDDDDMFVPEPSAVSESEQDSPAPPPP